MIVSTDAIVLRSMKYGETSKIVTVYSQRYGKIKLMAKGARSAKNKFGASLEPMTHSVMILYRKEHRELHLLSKAEIVEPFLNLNDDSKKLAVGLAIVELVNMVMHDEEENRPMYALLEASLQAANETTANVMNVLLAFEMRMCQIFGYGFSIDRCSVCGRDIVEDRQVDRAFLMLATGSAVCSVCHSRLHSGGIALSKGVVRAMVYLQSAALDGMTALRLSSSSRDEILATLFTYLRYHIEGVRTLKSLSLFNEV
ncbi:MAG TPA: DNA repair protein RecO [Bacteroidota bacterium]|nr:DNA repair protein RecO [Bacteroidota bacterium]